MTTATVEKIPCPKCGTRVRPLGMKLHEHHKHNEQSSPRPAQEDAPAPELPEAPRGPRPGAVVGIGIGKQKVTWTMRALEEEFGMVSWLPPETTDIMYGGVGVRVQGGEEVTLPKIFVDIFLQSRVELRKPGTYRQRGDEVGVQVIKGAGPLQQSP
jgi:hypothetical protein